MLPTGTIATCKLWGYQTDTAQINFSRILRGACCGCVQLPMHNAYERHQSLGTHFRKECFTKTKPSRPCRAGLKIPQVEPRMIWKTP